MSKIFFNGPGGLVVPRLASDPLVGVDGEIYYNTVDGKIKQFGGGTWGDVGSSKESHARVATFSNVTIASAPASIDGVTLSSGNIVLLTNQSSLSSNGLYVFNGTGNAMTREPGWSKNTDFYRGRQVTVLEGNRFKDTVWAVQADVATLGVDNILFEKVGFGNIISDNLVLPYLDSVVQLGEVSTGFGSIYSYNFYVIGNTTAAAILTYTTNPSTLTQMGSVTAALAGQNLGINTILATATNSGSLYLGSGNTNGTSRDTGLVEIKSGNAVGPTSNSGNIDIKIGTATGTRGKVRLQDGSEGTSGHIWTSTDANGSGAWQANSFWNSVIPNDTFLLWRNAANDNNIGAIKINDGDTLILQSPQAIFNYANGAGFYAYSTGELILSSANQAVLQSATGTNVGTDQSTGSTASTVIFTGNSTTAGDSGTIEIRTGTVTSGTRGKIALKDGSEGTVGHVWTSTGVNGEGAWAAPSGGGGGDAWSDPVDSNIIPDTDATYDLGSFSSKFQYLYANGVLLSGPNATNYFYQENSDDTTKSIQFIVNDSSSPFNSSSYKGSDFTTEILTTAKTIFTAGADLEINSSGSGSSNSPNLTLATGNRISTFNSGNITLSTGTVVSGTRGNIVLEGQNVDVSGMSSAVAMPIWKKYTVSYTALATAATTNNIELFSLPQNGAIHNVIIKHTTAFSGGTISAYTVSVGIAGDLTKYASAFDVFQATGNTVAQASSTFDVENFGAATSIRIAATSTGDNLNAATAGLVDVYVLWGIIE